MNICWYQIEPDLGSSHLGGVLVALVDVPDRGSFGVVVPHDGSDLV